MNMAWYFVARVPAFHRQPVQWAMIRPPGMIDSRCTDRLWWFKMSSRGGAGTALTMFRQANRGKPMRTMVADLPSIPLQWRV